MTYMFNEEVPSGAPLIVFVFRCFLFLVFLTIINRNRCFLFLVFLTIINRNTYVWPTYHKAELRWGRASIAMYMA
jgi:hypothetical protein